VGKIAVLEYFFYLDYKVAGYQLVWVSTILGAFHLLMIEVVVVMDG